MMSNRITVAVGLAVLLVSMAAGNAFADVAPPEDETCDGSTAGDWCSEWNGCESGTCVRTETNSDGEPVEVRVDCLLECESEECVECDEEEDGGPPDDPDAGAGDASIIYTTTAGGCNMTAERVSALGPLLIALAVPLFVFARRRLR